MHELGQIGLWSLQDQMKVVAHQGEQVKTRTMLFNPILQTLQETIAVFSFSPTNNLSRSCFQEPSLRLVT